MLKPSKDWTSKAQKFNASVMELVVFPSLEVGVRKGVSVRVRPLAPIVLGYNGELAGSIPVWSTIKYSQQPNTDA